MTIFASRHCEERSNLVKFNISMLRINVIGRSPELDSGGNPECFICYLFFMPKLKIFRALIFLFLGRNGL